MSIFLLGHEKGPAGHLLETMGEPVRKWAFDVEVLVRGIDHETQQFHFFVKNIDKPTYTFNYEQINEYGYKHKILTGIELGDLGMTFYDDSRNRVLNFLHYYMRQVSYPGNARYRMKNQIFNMEREGFATAGVRPSSGLDNTVIQQIKINQYRGFGPDGTAQGMIRSWTFEQPQIISLDLDTVDAEDDSLSAITMQFNFKNVAMELANINYPHRPDNPLDSILQLDRAVMYELDAMIPTDFPFLETGSPFLDEVIGSQVDVARSEEVIRPLDRELKRGSPERQVSFKDRQVLRDGYSRSSTGDSSGGQSVNNPTPSTTDQLRSLNKI